MSRSIGGQSRVYQPVTGGVPGGRRANVLSPARCTFTESFNKADGTLGPDVEWTVPETETYVPNIAQVTDSQFATAYVADEYIGIKGANGDAFVTSPLCSSNCYVEATISAFAVPEHQYSSALVALWLRTIIPTGGASPSTFAKFIVGLLRFDDTYLINVQINDAAGYQSESADNAVEIGAGTRLRLEAQDTTYRAFIDDALIITLTETGTTKPRGLHAGCGVTMQYVPAEDAFASDARLDAFKAGSL